MELFRAAVWVLFYINDLPDLIDGGVCIKLFADDVKLYTNITLPPDVKNVALQEHPDKLAKWANGCQSLIRSAA